MPEWIISLNNRTIKHFTINEGETLSIGRGSDADVIIDNTAISRQHAALELKNGGYYISDLFSLNGTKVNGEKIESTVPIAENDKVEIGKFVLASAVDAEQPSPTSYASPMDMHNDTIFISPPKSPSPSEKTASDDTTRKLTLLAGNATPAEVAVDDKQAVSIGKNSSCDMIISSLFVADIQCLVVARGDDKHYIVPSKSWTTTKVNGIPIKEERRLQPGDTLEIREVRIRFD